MEDHRYYAQDAEKSEVRGQRSESRDQKSEAPDDQPPLTSDLSLRCGMTEDSGRRVSDLILSCNFFSTFTNQNVCLVREPACSPERTFSSAGPSDHIVMMPLHLEET